MSYLKQNSSYWRCSS